jgi:hypothetical protein
MKPWWLFVRAAMFSHGGFTLLLVFPMNSNAWRERLVRFSTNIWRDSSTLRNVCRANLATNIYMLYYYVIQLGKYRAQANRAKIGGGQFDVNFFKRAKYLESQRYAYVTGISIFTYIVNWRLLSIQTQLHAARDALGRALAAAAVAAAVVQEPGGATAGIEQEEDETGRQERS